MAGSRRMSRTVGAMSTISTGPSIRVSAGNETGGPHEHRNLHALPVEEDPVSSLAMLSEALAVVADDHHKAPIEDPVAAQPFDEIPEAGIHVRNLPVVALSLQWVVGRLGRRVRVVRVVVMDPEKEPRGFSLIEPLEDVAVDLAGGPLGPLRDRRQLPGNISVDPEPLIEPETGIEDVGRDDRRGVEARRSGVQPGSSPTPRAGRARCAAHRERVDTTRS